MFREYRTRMAFRRFPELSELRASERQEVLRRATALGVRSSSIKSSLVALAAIVPGVLIAVLVGSFVSVFLVVLGRWTPGLHPGLAAPALSLFVGLSVVVATVMFAVTWVETRAVKQQLRAQLNRAECVKCGYSLAGLSAQEGVLVCPECGVRTRLPAVTATTP